MPDLPMDLLARARDDAGVFAELLVGEPLWPHQLDLVRSPARTRCVLAGRQCGKSRALAVLALHEAFRGAQRLVLIVSATELGAKRLLAEVAALASSPVLAGSVVDEAKMEIGLSNGSRIVSVPASERAVRGWTADLLIVDEACFVPDEVMTAARYTTVARQGRRVMASSPYGRRDRPFAAAFEAGRAGAEGFASFQWPSTLSPLVSEAVLEEWRPTMTDREWSMEVLGEWAEDAGAYFTSDELEGAVADYTMCDPARARRQLVAGGVDWGMAHDANAAALVGVLADGDLNAERHPEGLVFFVAWLEEHFRMPYGVFIDRLVHLAGGGFVDDFGRQLGYWVRCWASETNGVGAYPTEELRARLGRADTGSWCYPVHTDARRKESMFGAMKVLLQQGRLVLPRHPGLLRQLAALEFEQLPSGSTRIAVPERAGHDDLVMALGQAVSCLSLGRQRLGRVELEGDGDVLVTAGGTRILSRPVAFEDLAAVRHPKGGEAGEGW